MSTHRAPKRRKLDDVDDDDDELAQSSLSSPKTRRTPITYGKKTRSSPAMRPGQDAAKKAIQRSSDPARSRKDVELDLYDDIEGASMGRTTSGSAKRRAQDDELKKTAGMGIDAHEKRENLDPLKNQKNQKYKGPKKTGESLGFFKRFALAKAAEAEVATAAAAAAAAATNANGYSGGAADRPNGHHTTLSSRVNGASHRVNKGDGHDESGSEEEDEDEAAENLRGTGLWKGYVYGKPKKTFEDEIRELEENARRKAANRESEDELAAESNTPRPSTERTKRRSARAVGHLTTPASAPPKPLDRRKAQRPASKATMIEPHVEDQMEIEESESEPEPEPEPEPEHKPTEKPPAMRIIAPPANTSTPQKSSKPHSVEKYSKVANTTFASEQLSLIQKVLMERATGKRAIPLTNLDEERAKVYTVINQTVTAGESNSMLLIGARGSGKTALISQILQEQTAKHSEDFHVVRLNGFVHTDDKIAVREIWRQLGREMDLDEEENTLKNIADTMSKLLALLSHPTETGTDVPDQVTKSVIIILDEFELFATHPRQTLLYNLFDLAQSRKAPLAVIGLTTRIDVAETLEKRVKSRFSHRYVHLGLSKSFLAFDQICHSALEINPEQLTSEDLVSAARSKTDAPGALSKWSALAEKILASEQTVLFLKRLYHTTKSIPGFLAALAFAVATMPLDPLTTGAALLEHFAECFGQSALGPPDSKLSMLSSLSTLQLALLVCAARLTNVYNTEVITFALTYEEYKALGSKAKLQASAAGSLAQGAGSRVSSKDVAKSAWEDLVDCGFVIEEGRAGGAGRVDVGLEEIGMSGVDLGQWARWCKEI